MEKITITQLLDKYPKIFPKNDVKDGYTNWRGVPDGWLPIIDKLCSSIQGYIDNVYQSVPNPNYVEGIQFDAENTDTHAYIRQYTEQVVCLQMKEKFGGLCFYFTKVVPKVIEGMVYMAQKMCSNTCSHCSSEENLGMLTGWVIVCCEPCAASLGKLDRWKKKLKYNEDGRCISS